MPNYADILGERFTGIEWVMDDVADYATLRMIDGAKPTRAAIEAEEAAALAAREARRAAAGGTR